MKQELKDKLIQKVKEHVESIRTKIVNVVEIKEKRDSVMAKEISKLAGGDAIAQWTIMVYNRKHVRDLKELYPSPYFARCDFDSGEKKTLYFAKFSFPEEGIYSWITPVATLRFENPGQASYTRPDGSSQSGLIIEKDQYLIADGKLLFFATESLDTSRELVYQENFTRKKSGFVLPEVVEQMEKAQDQIIRAEYKGPLVISGPAGSGKTTLALHRVAYLAQSPESADLFTPDKVLILVQDTGTKNYFSQLLPELGIQGIEIQTFADWAIGVLGLKGYSYVLGYGENGVERIRYEYAKLQALQNNPEIDYSKNSYIALIKIYEPYFDVKNMKLWQKQKVDKVLDRFDLTLLLSAYRKNKGVFQIEKEYFEELQNGNYRKRKGFFPAEYNLLIVDEFQNYLPEQLEIFKSCLNEKTESVVYVGDLAQQTQLGTIRELGQIDSRVQTERLVTLQKVYRNTKQILQYVQSLGFKVTVPESLKEGKEVVEKNFTSSVEEIDFIKSIIKDSNESVVGILAKEKKYLEPFKIEFKNKNIFCLSFQEAQGVEFDTVFLVGPIESALSLPYVPEKVAQEIKKIQEDLFYVALTRAISELYVLGAQSKGLTHP